MTVFLYVLGLGLIATGGVTGYLVGMLCLGLLVGWRLGGDAR